tara:strand:+ start:4553 stop:4735 length:183 start_codon:yes stop_codon:yes gene_type:complete
MNTGMDSGEKQAGKSQDSRKRKKKKGRKTDPQMTNETRKIRKNHNLKSHPLRFKLSAPAA